MRICAVYNIVASAAAAAATTTAAATAIAAFFRHHHTANEINLLQKIVDSLSKTLKSQCPN